MKKRVIKYFLFFASVLFSACLTIKADLIDYSGGNTGSSGSIGSGSWSSKYVGVKISIVNSSNKLEDVEIFVNENGKAGKFSYENLPKTKQSYDITWVESSGRTAYKNTNLPKSWLNGSNKNINLYSYLATDNYDLLIELIETSGAFNTLSTGDYILVEPMVYIGGYYGTGFELGRAFFKINSCNSGSFCYSYGRRIFGGSSTNTSGGLFFTTLYVDTAIPDIGIYNMKKWLERNPEVDTNNTYKNRHKCIMAKSCGRCIGVFKYDEIYKGALKIVKKDKNTDAKLAGAGFTLYSDSSCTKVFRNQQTTNSNGEVIFNNLPTNKYYYKETKVPSGYTGDSNCRLANITNGKTNTVSVNNGKNVTEGNLKIYIKNNITKQIITNVDSQAEYEIYKGSNCSGTRVKTINTSSGVALVNNLEVGTYSIKEISAPSGYEPSKNKCVKKSVTISANSTKEETIFYEPTCTTRLNSSDKSIKSLLELYQDFKFNGLLDYNNPKCSKIECPPPGEENPVSSCLAGSINTPTFTEYNMACFNESLQNLRGEYVGFCINTFNLTNNLGTSNFYNKSGQFIIRKTMDNKIQFYSGENNLVEVANPYVASANVGKICYALNGNPPAEAQISRPSIKVYFGNNNISDAIEVEELSEEKSTTSNVNYTANGFVRYYYNDHYDFNLNTVYLKKITGKVVAEKRGTLSDVGVIIPFNTTSGVIPFKLKYGDKEFSSNDCTYSSNPEIIKYPPDKENGEIDLEFRIVNSEKPFLNEKGEIRQTNSNWCDYNASEEEQCNADNSIVIENIINAPDSYGRNSTGPLYRIILTSSDIQKIKEYNQENPYDNYEVYCTLSGECSNAFVMDLKNKVLNKYENERVVKNYGSIAELIYTPRT